ncbi:myo-inosose-2 dehydratase [Bacillus cytotoxicus]|uniref:Inosose dehydratase n=1 Tax=Bacillus cytotoxicus TaxID=580165 RepID=A0AAX2CGW6_9BACI|nr:MULTISPECIES: myo-inosose-2 dehydratase [Bacillus cereus group]QTR69352.1 myo-inosose-2 dehydratase [Bacillus cytotoxicus]QTR78051.1 myo-inosose-2 dehydratase [Bacillus cytotoxicus]QTR82128.1 myo-inosose-2 dehydratase [Bacillus cytotoxicus]QTR85866.1 myo-inosose-2 dehydratase [Bacillus cytotoxicus]SCL92941.1 Inosose dehydratase [Bacillus cytotoxicus]
MFKEGTVKLGIAPIGWTNDDMPELGKENTFEQCISEMALAGFTGTEVGNKYPRDVDVLKKALSLRKMEIASAWFSAYVTTKPLHETVNPFIEHCDFLQKMGAKVVVVSEQGHSIQGLMNTPLFEKKPIFDEESWQKLAEGLNILGKLAQERGLYLVYHHHMGTGVQTTAEIEKLMSLTNPNVVHLLYDTGHLVFSGEDPMYILEKYMDRIKHVHLKDVRLNIAEKVKQNKLSFLQGVKEGVFTVPGDGSINFEPIFKKLAKKHYTGWLLVEAEQDPAKANPFEYAVKARTYINEICNLKKQNR